jgi:hypothetical protein
MGGRQGEVPEHLSIYAPFSPSSPRGWSGTEDGILGSRIILEYEGEGGTRNPFQTWALYIHLRKLEVTSTPSGSLGTNTLMNFFLKLSV